MRAIQGLTVTDANYDAAINILNQRFGKPQQIISAHMDELLRIQARPVMETSRRNCVLFTTRLVYTSEG